MLQSKLKIYVTELISFEYCQMLYYLMKRHVQSIDENVNVRMIKGKITHSKLYNNHYKNTNTFDSINSVALKTLHDGKTRLIRELRVTKESENYLLIGRIDEVRIEKDRIVIVDDKDIEELTPLMKTMYLHQLELYASLFYENFYPFLEIYYELRIANTKKLFFSYKFNQAKVSFNLEEHINILLEYWNGEILLEKTKIKKKCEECRFCSYCNDR